MHPQPVTSAQRVRLRAHTPCQVLGKILPVELGDRAAESLQVRLESLHAAVLERDGLEYAPGRVRSGPCRALAAHHVARIIRHDRVGLRVDSSLRAPPRSYWST